MKPSVKDISLLEPRKKRGNQKYAAARRTQNCRCCALRATLPGNRKSTGGDGAQLQLLPRFRRQGGNGRPPKRARGGRPIRLCLADAPPGRERTTHRSKAKRNKKKCKHPYEGPMRTQNQKRNRSNVVLYHTPNLGNSNRARGFTRRDVAELLLSQTTASQKKKKGVGQKDGK